MAGRISPKSEVTGRRTSPSPKQCCHNRFPHTRGVRGFDESITRWANSSRPLPLSKGSGGPLVNSERKCRGTRGPLLAGLPPKDSSVGQTVAIKQCYGYTGFLSAVIANDLLHPAVSKVHCRFPNQSGLRGNYLFVGTSQGAVTP